MNKRGIFLVAMITFDRPEYANVESDLVRSSEHPFTKFCTTKYHSPCQR